jgi:hypothetical protein
VELSLELVKVHRFIKTMPLVAAAAAVAATGASGQAPPPAQLLDPNPCLTEAVAQLNCPDLVMKRPFRLDTERSRGRTLLRAGNSIDSVGRGPAELHGVRASSRFMDARQRIYRRSGGRMGVTTGAQLQFKYGHLKRRYWKFYEAARFELFTLDAAGERSRRVRTGPKVSYCLRDLKRTRPLLARSPRKEVYPACSTSPGKQRVTLGTSVGWSDVYPPSYPEQYIDVSRLRGCFAYVHTADPENGIYESNEENNQSQVIVRLPWRGAGNRGCPGRSFGPSSRGEPDEYY